MNPKAVALAALLALASLAPAAAKTFELPDGKPIITIDIPNAWSPEETDDGAQGTSPDKSVYVALETAKIEVLDKAVANTIKFLKENDVKVDESTQKRTDAKSNGMDVLQYTWSGTDDDGPTTIAMSIFIASPEEVAILTFWGSPAGERKYAAQLDAIAKSIQPLKR